VFLQAVQSQAGKTNKTADFKGIPANLTITHTKHHRLIILTLHSLMMTKKPNSANADDLVSKPNFDCETFI
jgi:hypothetical protein